jgi:hypothetical protein
MQRIHRSILLTGFLILVLLVGCGRSAPAPITNPSSVETALAGTARALAKQTETAQGFTATPPVVPTETMTPTPKVSIVGTSLENLADGSTRFTDYTVGIQVVFPAGWLTVRVSEPEYYKAWDKYAVKSPALQEVFTGMQNNDPDQFRVTAIDIRSDVTYETVAKIQIVFAPGDERTLNEVRMSQTNRKYPFSKFKLLSSTLAKTPAGLDVAIVDFQWESASPENNISLSYHRDTLFKVASGTISIQLTTGLTEKDRLLPELDKVIDSIIFLAP